MLGPLCFSALAATTGASLMPPSGPTTTAGTHSGAMRPTGAPTPSRTTPRECVCGLCMTTTARSRMSSASRPVRWAGLAERWAGLAGRGRREPVVGRDLRAGDSGICGNAAGGGACLVQGVAKTWSDLCLLAKTLIRGAAGCQGQSQDLRIGWGLGWGRGLRAVDAMSSDPPGK